MTRGHVTLDALEPIRVTTFFLDKLGFIKCWHDSINCVRSSVLTDRHPLFSGFNYVLLYYTRSSHRVIQMFFVIIMCLQIQCLLNAEHYYFVLLFQTDLRWNDLQCIFSISVGITWLIYLFYNNTYSRPIRSLICYLERVNILSSREWQIVVQITIQISEMLRTYYYDSWSAFHSSFCADRLWTYLTWSTGTDYNIWIYRF